MFFPNKDVPIINLDETQIRKESRMGVTVVLDQCGYRDETRHRTEFVIEDIDRNLVDCIQEQLGGEHFISFNTYYRNSKVMLYDRVYPFILLGDGYHWYVSFKKVSASDFMRTNGILEGGQIYVEIDHNCGSGDFASFTVLDWINTLSACVKGMKVIVKSLEFATRHFVGENKRMIDIMDVIDMVQLKGERTLSDLMKDLKCSDQFIAEAIFNKAGYRFIDGRYVFDKQYMEEQLKDEVEDVDSLWTVDPIYEDYELTAISIFQINRYITALKYQKDDEVAHYYNKARVIADQLKDRWADTLCRGHHFQYLRIRKNAKQIGEDECEKLERDANDVSMRIAQILIEYEDKHRAEIDFNPKTAG